MTTFADGCRVSGTAITDYVALVRQESLEAVFVVMDQIDDHVSGRWGQKWLKLKAGLSVP